jgi:hypothetical protein
LLLMKISSMEYNILYAWNEVITSRKEYHEYVFFSVG